MNDTQKNKRMDNRTLDDLIGRYQRGELTGELRKLMDEWYQALGSGDETTWTDEELARLKTRIFTNLQDQTTPKTFKLRYWSSVAAAILLLAAGIGIYIYDQSAATPTEHQVDVKPGGNKALLTFSEGRTVNLSESKSGILVSSAGIHYDDGSVVTAIPDLTENEISGPMILTLSTPRGGQYQLTLPDGTRVWLNAQSTLVYPSRFGGDERVVELDGEAYFDVSQVSGIEPGPKIPFRVKTRNQTVEVVGTAFNISAYADEAITTTTLVSGRIGVQDHYGNSIQLRPNQQSLVGGNRNRIDVRDIDPTAAIAWKNNMFLFHNTSLSDIMRQLHRWYDVRIDIDQIPQETFFGEISRDVPLSEVLEMIEMTSQYEFKITINADNDGGRRVTMH